MSQLNVYLATFIPIFAAIFFVTMISLIFVLRKKNDTSFKGKRFFKLDLYARKVIKMSFGSDHKTIIKNIKPGIWVDLKRLTKQFALNDEITKKWRDALEKISAKREEAHIAFVSSMNGEKVKYNFNISFYPIHDDSDYLLSFSWRQIETHKEKVLPKMITREGVVSSSLYFKGFIALNLNSDIQDVEKKMMKLIIRSKENKIPIRFMMKGNILFVIFMHNNRSKLKRSLQSLADFLDKEGRRRGSRYLFHGSSIFINKDIHDIKNLNRSIKGLEYFIYLSLIKDTEFFTSSSIEKGMIDFKSYATMMETFNAAVRVGKVEFEKIPVKNKSTSKKTIDYLQPKVEGIEKADLDKIILNKNHRASLIDSLAKNVSTTTGKRSPSIIDVSIDWLFENSKTLKAKDVIYCLNFHYDVDRERMVNTLRKLNEDGFVFGVRVRYFTEINHLLKTKRLVKFMLLDKSIWTNVEKYKIDAFTQLLTINSIASAKDIKLIFENPPQLDKNMSESIGFKFYMET